MQGVRKVAVRALHSSAVRPHKVTVVGAAGGIGQPLSLLMKLSSNITQLNLYDVAPVTPGVGADLSHINSAAKVTSFTGKDDALAKAISGSDVIVVPAGVPRKPGMTRDDLFNINASIVAGIAKSVALHAPKAMLLIISNPVNSTVPIAAEVLKKAGVYDPRRLIGVTTLDVVRANTFVAENQKLDVAKVKVPVVGGHAGITILPLLSQVSDTNFSQADKEALTKRIMFGGDEVVQAKAGAGSATLSMAYAGFVFTERILQALSGGKGVVECCYVQSTIVPGVSFFSSPVEFGKEGVEKVNGLGSLDDFEKKKLAEMIPELKASIAKGVEFVSKLAA